MRRRHCVVLALVVLALLPVSASASRTRMQQTFTATADVVAMDEACPSPEITTTNEHVVAAGTIDDEQDGLELELEPGGPFPNQVEGNFEFEGDHSFAAFEFTGVLSCPDSQTFTITGLAWSGIMIDFDAGQRYTISGAGRYNSFEATAGNGGLTITFAGNARPTTSAPR